MPPKALKIKRAFKKATRLRVPKVSGGRGSGRNTFSPIAGETPIVLVRVQVLGCKDLLAKDRNGFSDPFVVVSILNSRHQTPVSKRTLEPVYASKDATFDFPVYLSLADKLGVVELVVWDKDMLKKDYLGEVAFPLEDWFVDRSNPDADGNRPYAFDDPGNVPFSLPLVSTRAGTNSKGTVQLKLGFVNAPNTHSLLEFDEVFGELVKRTRTSLVSAPPTEGVGTVRSTTGGPLAYELEDDGGISSDEEGSDDDDFPDAADDPSGTSTANTTPTTTPSSLSGLYTPPTNAALNPIADIALLHPASASASPPDSPLTPTPATVNPSLDVTPTPTPAIPIPPPAKPQMKSSSSSSSFLPRMKFPKRSMSSNVVPGSGSSSAVTTPGTPPIDAKTRKSWTPGGRGSSPGSSGISGSDASPSAPLGPGDVAKSKGKKKAGYSFGGANDIVGIVMLEIQSADDLPRLHNMTRTGWDMDPFVVISFGKKVFRTRVIRHSRSPVWDEKLLFHVRRYETAFKVQLTILDWDKLSSNDYIGDAHFDVKDLLDNAPQPDPVTGLYAAEEGGDHPMTEFKRPLTTSKEMPWETKHNPVITFRAKFQPYAGLRQRFWRQYLMQYDTDDTGALSHLELTSMLDSLGSTLTRSTVNSFFTRFNKNPHTDELTVPEAIQCLETELGRPDSEKKRLDADDGLPDTSVNATPLLSSGDRQLSLDDLDFSGPSLHGGTVATPDLERTDKAGAPSGYPTEPMQVPLTGSAASTPGGEDGDPMSGIGRDVSYSSSDGEEAEDSSGSGTNSNSNNSNPDPVAAQKKKKYRFRKAKKAKKTGAVSTAAGAEDPLERVINVRNCPLCHRPRLNSKAEMDIVTHLAVCASQDWNRVDKIISGNFVTASQAQRKWYTKIISKVSSGDYRLGANSANIIVQNRMTGQLEEEKMQVYVRLGIRLLYKGATSRMEGGRARRLLKSLSIKQGIKYDSPESARDIPQFIQFHGLKVDEIQDPLDSFKTFNQFFYRKLKPSARPIEEPDNPYRLVSGADCRLMSFATVNEATKLWIKGREFTVARLLGDAYKGQAEKYHGGALAIFRLAPQDYHRFHSPVEGTIGPMTYISGEYYTVNPQAIRTALDVYGENARKIVPIDSPHFGRVMAVCIGAMMVGSIQTTVQEGEYVKRGQEFGYFAFGGSTIVLLFEKGAVEWDEDLLINGRASLETLVRVGMGIGKKPTST